MFKKLMISASLVTCYISLTIITSTPVFSQTPSFDTNASTPATPFSIDDVIERVNHFVDEDPARPGIFFSNDITYAAEFEQGEFRFIPWVSQLAPEQRDVADTFHFRLDSLSRGETYFISFANEQPVTQVEENRVILEWHPNVVEQYVMKRGKVEQSWRIVEPIPGEGDLVLRAAAWGMDFVGEENDEGFCFSTVSGTGVSYGWAKALDQAGQEVEAPVSVVPGETGNWVEIRVPDRFLREATWPVLIDPTVKFIEFDDNASRQLTFDPMIEGNPSVASNQDVFLLVWDSALYTNVYGARVDRFGNVLGSPIPIATSFTLLELNPSVASDGTNFLVIWQEKLLSSGNYDIYGRRIGPDGSLHGSKFAISTATNHQKNSHVTWGDDGVSAYYLAVWQDDRGLNSDIYGARVTSNGSVQDLNGILISKTSSGLPQPGNQIEPSVAWGDDGASAYFLVVWQDGRSSTQDIYGARITLSGTVQDAGGIAISTAANDQLQPDVAWGGVNFLAVWDDRRTQSNPEIYGARVTMGSSVSADINISGGATLVDTEPSVASDGRTYFLVVWAHKPVSFGSFVIKGTRVDSNGTIIGSTVTISDGTADQSNPGVVSDGSTHFLVVWENESEASTDIYGARVGSSSPITIAPNNQQAANHIGVASNGTDFFVVWRDYRFDSYGDIYGARVSSNGTVLDPLGIPISTAVYYQTEPRVAWGNDGINAYYLVVWGDWRSGNTYDIYGTRVSPNGTVQDPAGIAISTANKNQYFPSVAWSGSGPNACFCFLVVWHDYRNTATYEIDIYGSRVNLNGTVLDPSAIPIHLSSDIPNDPGSQYPDVAWGEDGTNASCFLVVWNQIIDIGFGRVALDNVYGARVGPSGTVLDPDGIPISTAPYPIDEELPQVAWGRSGTIGYFLVVWNDGRDPDEDIYGARLKLNGTVADPSGIAIATAPYGQVLPAVAWENAQNNFFVVWEDFINYPDRDLYGTRVNLDGIVLESSGIPISTSPLSEEKPALSWNGVDFLIMRQEAHSNASKDVYGSLVTPTP